MKADIRPATLDDVPAMVELGAQFLATSPYADYAEIDGGALADTLADMIEADHALVLVATVSNAAPDLGAVIGGIVGTLAPLWFAPSTLVAMEMAWFVHPAHRGTAGLALARQFERWAIDNGVDLIAFSELRGAGADAWPVGEALAKAGYTAAERTHIKGVE